MAHSPGHEIQTVPRLGWSGVKNGELLPRMSGAFEVLVTVDQGLEFQQNLGEMTVGLVETFVARAPRIDHATRSVKPGEVLRVTAESRRAS